MYEYVYNYISICDIRNITIKIKQCTPYIYPMEYSAEHFVARMLIMYLTVSRDARRFASTYASTWFSSFIRTIHL